MPAQYLEIVSTDVDGVVGLYEQTLRLTFGEPDADLGLARVAMQTDGSLIGVRKPLGSQEEPIVRSYLEVADIAAAVRAAETAGGMVAYGPTEQGQRGTFAIYFLGGAQHGFWQR